MSSRSCLTVSFAGLLVWLTGCATEATSLDAYQPPPARTPAAHLKGSRINEGGLFGSDHTGFVAMIDLKPVPDARANWNESIALAPGKHTIVAEYRYSNFMARAYLPLEAKAGAGYQLKIKNGTESPPSTHIYNDFWIVEDATGKLVTPVYRQQATGGKKGTVFNVTY